MQAVNDTPVYQLHRRILTLFVWCALGYLILGLRFIYLQAIPHGKDLADRDDEVMYIAARRGDILDRNGRPLATSIDGFDVWVRPQLIQKDKLQDTVITSLSGITHLPAQFIAARVNKNCRFAFIKRHVSHSIGKAVIALKLPGVGADPVFLRTYPCGTLAAQVLGRVNIDGLGTAGIEQGMNDELQGQNGIIKCHIDGKGQPIPGTERVIQPAHNGSDIQLTIDSRIQEVAERELDKMVTGHHAAGGCTVVMDVQTGAILAMASRPTFNPNLPVTNMAALLNRGISYAYEPGSTFKAVTASAALSEKTWDLTRTVTCTGTMRIGNRTIHCVVEPPYHGGHGVETLRDILRNSCNIGAATVGLRLGADKLYKYIRRFGLLNRSVLGLPGAVAYRLTDPRRWSRIRLANVSFGQGVMVTPIQLLCAYCAIANHGIMMKPRIVRQVSNADTNTSRTIDATVMRRIISPTVANDVVGFLEAVVYDGTGKTAEFPGYTVAGKTGSAQVAGPHGYVQGKFIASFVGFAPASNPRVACITMIDEPQGIHWGAVLGAPVVREVLRWSMQYLQIPPDDPSLTADGADFATIIRQEHQNTPLPGSVGWHLSPQGPAPIISPTGADGSISPSLAPNPPGNSGHNASTHHGKHIA